MIKNINTNKINLDTLKKIIIENKNKIGVLVEKVEKEGDSESDILKFKKEINELEEMNKNFDSLNHMGENEALGILTKIKEAYKKDKKKEISPKELSEKIKEDYGTGNNINKYGEKNDYLIKDLPKHLWRKVVQQPYARTQINGFGPIRSVLSYAYSAASWAINTGIDNVGMIKGEKFKPAKFEIPDPEKDLEKNINTLLYQDGNRVIDDSNLDFIIKNMLENDSIRKYILKSGKDSKVASLFSTAFHRKMSLSSADGKSSLYKKMLKEFNRDGVVIDGDLELKKSVSEMKDLGGNMRIRETVSENSELFNVAFLGSNVFKDSQLESSLSISKKNDYSSSVFTNDFNTKMSKIMSDDEYREMNLSFVKEEILSSITKMGIKITAEDLDGFTPETIVNMVSNISTLHMINERLKEDEHRMEILLSKEKNGLVDKKIIEELQKFSVADEFSALTSTYRDDKIGSTMSARAKALVDKRREIMDRKALSVKITDELMKSVLDEEKMKTEEEDKKDVYVEKESNEGKIENHEGLEPEKFGDINNEDVKEDKEKVNLDIRIEASVGVIEKLAEQVEKEIVNNFIAGKSIEGEIRHSIVERIRKRMTTEGGNFRVSAKELETYYKKNAQNKTKQNQVVEVGVSKTQHQHQ